MKRFLLLTLIVSVTVIIYNCDDSGLLPEEKTLEISGKVNNWSLGAKILKAIVKDSTGSNVFLADSTTIANDGSFTLKIKTPPDNFFWIYSVITDTNCPGAITITPPGLKQTPVSFDVYTDTNTYMGKLQKNSVGYPVTPGSHSVSYINFKDAGSATGSTTCSDSTISIKITANFTGTAGWNTVVLVWNIFNPIYPPRYDATIQNSEPAASLWYYVP